MSKSGIIPAMKPTDRQNIKIALIGAGNVATHLAVNLYQAGFNICMVVARHIESATALASRVGAVPTANIGDIDSDIDLAIISTTDTAVKDVAGTLPHIRGVVAHTSGSVPLDVLSVRHEHAAVIYPLQTFSKNSEVDMSRVPFFTEATDNESLELADAVAGSFGDHVFHAGSDIRARLHIAGVFACNFSVYMFEMARKALAEAGLPLDTVRPLVDVTVDKAFNLGPMKAMTGPARRGDIATVEKQMSQIGDPLEKEIYSLISQAIYKEFNN